MVIEPGELWEGTFTFKNSPLPPHSFRLRFDGDQTLTLESDAEQQMSMQVLDWAHPPRKAGALQAELLPGAGDAPLGVLLCRKHPSPEPGPVLFKDVRLTLAYRVRVRSIKLFAIELVRIPEGAFSLGDPTGEGLNASFYDVVKQREAAASDDDEADASYRVTSEAEIQLGEQLGFDAHNEYTATSINLKGQTVPSAFPKGFNAFYLMKYQVSQGEYAAFINELRGPARTLRFPYAEGSHRFEIYMSNDARKRRIATRPHRACNWLSWTDGIVFADWAGLRPMTEFEYEKACRGFREPENREFAWGSAKAERALVVLGDEGQGSEIVVGNCTFDKTIFQGGDRGQGPVREDAFVSGEALRRLTHHGISAGAEKHPTLEEPDWCEAAGASYWGVYGLSGNLWECCVTVATPEGRSFWGHPGSGGVLAGDIRRGVDAYVAEWRWPGTNANGVGFRGGSWFTDENRLCLADRRYAGGLPGYMARSHDTGFRAVLSDPEYSRPLAIPLSKRRKKRTS
jgi:formylglycine-generating enzyme required for sulfatase activity